jgi:hypothetical protein
MAATCIVPWWRVSRIAANCGFIPLLAPRRERPGRPNSERGVRGAASGSRNPRLLDIGSLANRLARVTFWRRHRLLTDQLRAFALLIFKPTYTATLPQIEAAATQPGLKPLVHPAGSQEETAAALSAMLSEHVEAINVLASPKLFLGRASIMERLAKAAVPAIYEFPEMAEEGGLMAHGQRLSLSFRQLATLVDKIQRGAKSADHRSRLACSH